MVVGLGIVCMALLLRFDATVVFDPTTIVGFLRGAIACTMREWLMMQMKVNIRVTRQP